MTNTCKQQNKILDRKAVYYNYVGANSCAKSEQKRIDQEEEMRASAARDRAAGNYLNEAAKTERIYRNKYNIHYIEHPNSYPQEPPIEPNQTKSYKPRKRKGIKSN